MEPDKPLLAAIDRVYEVFGRYVEPMHMDASPVHDPAELKVLLTTPLRRLGVDELSGYASWAMTTVGEVEDYKHFLPRILELTVASGALDPELIVLKLRYGHWQEWPQREKTAVIDVFREASIQAIGEHPDDYLADSWFCGMALLNLDLQPIMRDWESSSSANAALQLAQLLRSTLLFENDPHENGYWGEVDVDTVKTIRTWALGPTAYAKLTSAKLAVSSGDLRILDLALEERARLVGQQLQ